MSKIIGFIFFLSICVYSVAVQANPETYNFKDPKGVNAVSIILDSALEPNTGFANTIDGTITFDPVEKKILAGKFTVPTSSIIMSNNTMTQVLHSKSWLNADAYPAITFDYLRTIAIGETIDTKYQLTVEGNLTIAGVTQIITAPVTLTFHPGKLKDRNPGDNGDLVVLRSTFGIDRKAFNINTAVPDSIVANIIQLKLNIVGASRTPKP